MLGSGLVLVVGLVVLWAISEYVRVLVVASDIVVSSPVSWDVRAFRISFWMICNMVGVVSWLSLGAVDADCLRASWIFNSAICFS